MNITIKQRDFTLKLLEDFGEDTSGDARRKYYDSILSISNDELDNNQTIILYLKMFIVIYRAVFYDDGIVLTSINSRLFYPKDIRFFKVLKKLMESEIVHKYKIIIIGPISEFIIMYYLSLLSFDYSNSILNKKYKVEFEKELTTKNIYSKYAESLDKYYEEIVFNEYFEGLKYYGDRFITNIYVLYKKIMKDKRLLQRFFIKFIGNGRFHEMLIDLAKDGDILIDISSSFFEYYSTKDSLLSNDMNSLLKLHERKIVIPETLLKKALNNIIDDVNGIVSGKFNDEFMMVLSRLEHLLKDINVLGQVLKSNLKVKLNICRLHLLSFKRTMLGDEETVNKNMHKFESKVNIPIDVVSKVKEQIDTNPFAIYQFVVFDIYKAIEESIINRSNYSLAYMVSKTSIDTKNMLFIKGEQNKDIFKESIEDIGKKIYSKIALNDNKLDSDDKKLLNPVNKDYLETMVDYLMLGQSSKISFVLNTIDYNKFLINLKNYFYKELEMDIIKDEVFSSDYVFNFHILLIVQSNIRTLYTNIKNIRESILKTGEMLLKLFNRVEDSLKSDIYFIYFVLYSEKGYNLRNKYSHGNIEKPENQYYLITLITCYICLSKIQNHLESNDTDE